MGLRRLECALYIVENTQVLKVMAGKTAMLYRKQYRLNRIGRINRPVLFSHASTKVTSTSRRSPSGVFDRASIS